jgi:hypothetical protein
MHGATMSGTAESLSNMGTSAVPFNEASDMRELLNLQTQDTAGSATQGSYWSTARIVHVSGR